MPTLFDPIQAGDWKLPNRIIMAPLTRRRATEEFVPTPLMAEYYAQRASAGLILTEATVVTRNGIGYPKTPGIWTQEQAEGWKQITKAVHDAGGRIFCQLWHVGRISHSSLLNGELPVAPSAIAAEGQVNVLRPVRSFETPRALERDEIVEIIEAFRIGAKHAMDAGFDGVEIHSANGYLIDQFIQDSTNHRTDEYGGSIENRARFLLQIVDAAISVWGAGKVGVHLAPRCDMHNMGDSDPVSTFTYIAKTLGERKIAFIFARASRGNDNLGLQLKEAFGGVYIANQEQTKETGNAALAAGEADAISYGIPYIANPDLVKRFATDAALNDPRRDFFGEGGAEGYVDYPLLENV